MQGPEEKKRVGKHAAPPEPIQENDVLRTDADLYGDEADVPLRPKKKTLHRPEADAIEKALFKEKEDVCALTSVLGNGKAKVPQAPCAVRNRP